MRVSPYSRPLFGQFNPVQELILKHVKSSDTALLNNYEKALLGDRGSLSSQERNAIRSATKMRLESTHSMAFLERLEGILAKLPGSSVEPELFQSYAMACSRVYGGPYGNI